MPKFGKKLTKKLLIKACFVNFSIRWLSWMTCSAKNILINRPSFGVNIQWPCVQSNMLTYICGSPSTVSTRCLHYCHSALNAEDNLLMATANVITSLRCRDHDNNNITYNNNNCDNKNNNSILYTVIMYTACFMLYILLSLLSRFYWPSTRNQHHSDKRLLQSNRRDIKDPTTEWGCNYWNL